MPPAPSLRMTSYLLSKTRPITGGMLPERETVTGEGGGGCPRGALGGPRRRVCTAGPYRVVGTPPRNAALPAPAHLSAASSTARATGAATAPPVPAFSTTTATTICGSSAGAKPTNQACGSPVTHFGRARLACHAHARHGGRGAGAVARRRPPSGLAAWPPLRRRWESATPGFRPFEHRLPIVTHLGH